eukprot:7217411-Pyramimonas_sp.AAC.1
MSKKDAIDNTLHAVKVFVSQLKPCLEQAEVESWTPTDRWSLLHSKGDVPFQRVWIQVPMLTNLRRVHFRVYETSLLFGL